MKKLYFLFLLFAATACGPQRLITYNTDALTTDPEAPAPLPVALSIQTFNDIRAEYEDNAKVLNTKNNSSGMAMYINADLQYKETPGKQMAEIFVWHLLKKGYFQTVGLDIKEASDYYVTANLAHFYAEQKQHVGAVIGSQFGLIGAIASSGAKSEGRIIIELTDITVRDKNDRQIAHIGNFKKEYEGKFAADAYGHCVYGNINEKLREFNEELTRMLWSEVKANAGLPL